MATPAQLFYSELIQNPNLNETEHWFPISDEIKLSKYLISNWGNIQRKNTKYIITGCSGLTGYKYVNLTDDNGKKKSYLRHRLVADTFIDNNEKKPTVDHVDRNRSNNNVLNLRWATRSEQNANQRPQQPLSNKNVKTIIQYDLVSGDTIKTWKSMAEAAHEIGISSPSISDTCRGKGKSAKGFGWKYAEIDTIPDEIWLAIEGFSNYSISNLGRLKRINGKIIAGGKSLGYLITELIDDKNVATRLLIHRIVCATFNGPAPEGKNLVNHRDGNKLNNHASNLEWVSASENTQHAHDNGLINMANAHKNMRKAVIQYDTHMNEIARFDSITEAKKQTNASGIGEACRKHYISGGFRWTYAN